MSSGSPQEANTGTTRLEWSDDDGFFGEEEDDEKTPSSSDGEWEDSYDVVDDDDDDDDLNASQLRQFEPADESEDFDHSIADDDDSEQVVTEPEVSDGVAEEQPLLEACATTDEEHEPGEAVGGVSPAVAAATTPAPESPCAVSPHRNASGDKPPLPSRNGGERVVPRTPTIVSTGSGLMYSSSGKCVGHSTPIPLSLTGTPGTPFVELDNEDEKFEEIVRQRNRVRKEREDYHIAHIKVQMGRLEGALAAETKRRVDATTALDELARTQVHEMEERVKEQLRDENEKLQSRLGALEERVRRLEGNWINDANHQIEVVNSKASDLGKVISQIQDDQDMERKARLKREGILLRQVEDHAKETDDRWKSERKNRIERLKELEGSILHNEARLAMEQKRYEDRIEKELILLNEELAVETEERQAQDEQIVAALNRYTQQLQQSLSILSSD